MYKGCKAITLIAMLILQSQFKCGDEFETIKRLLDNWLVIKKNSNKSNDG